jgi:hypothetical protein
MSGRGPSAARPARGRQSRCARHSPTCSRPGCRARAVTVGAVLPPARDSDDDQARVLPLQNRGTQAHRFEGPGPEILDQHLRGGGEAEQQLAPAHLAQAECQALLVARIHLPMDADASALPGAQRIAPLRILDPDHLGAEIGELKTDHVARDQTRHVDDADSVERTGGAGIEGFLRHAHRQLRYGFPAAGGVTVRRAAIGAARMPLRSIFGIGRSSWPSTALASSL